MAVQSFPIVLKEDEVKQFELLREIVKQDIIKENKLSSIDDLSTNYFSDEFSKYNVTKEEFELGLKIYEIGINFIKTGNITELLDSVTKNRREIEKFNDLMSRLEPQEYPAALQRYEDHIYKKKFNTLF